MREPLAPRWGSFSFPVHPPRYLLLGSAQLKISRHGNSDSDRYYDYVHRSTP
jgi:hypothetical protein